MSSLMQISQQLDELALAVEESDGELSAELEAWFSELQASQHSKIDGYVAIVEMLEARAERAEAVAARCSKSAEALRFRMHEHLKHHGINRIDTDLHRVWRQNNGGYQPVEVDDVPPESLPGRFVKTSVEYSIDTTALRQALLAGEKLNFARLGERGEHLRIR